MKVKDYMRTKIVTIPQSMCFKKALEVMVKEKTNGLVVADEHGEAVGILDCFHMMFALVPDYLINDPMLASFVNDESFSKSVKEAADMPISKMMMPVKGYVLNENAPIVQAAAIATKKHIRYVPIVNDKNEIVGLLSRSEIKHALVDILGIEY